MDWLCKHGLSTNPVALDRGDKVFRYLLASRSREDLDRRLEIFERVCLPYIFDDEADQEEYLNYLLTTRFAPVGHRAHLRERWLLQWPRVRARAGQRARVEQLRAVQRRALGVRRAGPF